jgi:hypothetical protein
MNNLPEQINARLKGTVELENGSSSEPSLCFINSQNTGFYYTPNHINVSINGTNIYSFGSSGPIFDSAIFLQEIPIPNISGTEGALFKKIGDDGLYWKTQSGIINLATGGMSFPLLAPSTATPQYSFVDSNTTGISYFGTNLYFSNNGQASITVDSIHNVGIGSTTDPNNKLYIDGKTKINGDLLVLNNLYVNGTTYLIDTQNLNVINSYIELAANNLSDTLNIGVFGQYFSAGKKFSGIFRKASDGEWYIWKDYTGSPISNWIGAQLANLNVNKITGDLSGQVLAVTQNSITSIPNLTSIGELTELKMAGNLDLQNNDINSVDTINVTHVVSTDLSGSILTASQTNINQIAGTIEQTLEIAPLSDDNPYSFKVDGIIECLSLIEYNSVIFDQEFLLSNQTINANINGLFIDNFINYVDFPSAKINGVYTNIKSQLSIDNTANISSSPINSIIGIHELGIQFNDNLNGKNISNIYGIKIDNNPTIINGSITNLYGLYIGNCNDLINITNNYGLYSAAIINYINGLTIGNGGLNMDNYNIINVGTIDGEWVGDIIDPDKGGTGVSNSSTITIGGNLDFQGNYTFTATLTGNTNVTFPTSGTLLASSGGGYVSSITGTPEQIYTTGLTGDITLSLPQDISTTSSPTFDTLNTNNIYGTIQTSLQNNITGLGTITSGIWEANTINTLYGGTGNTNYLEGEILIGNNLGGLTKNTLTGTPEQINITNANGSITLSLPQDISTTSSPTFDTLNTNNIYGTIQTSLQNNITGLGTITSGIWEANTINTLYGGTGYNSYNPLEILVGNNSNTLEKLELIGMSNQIYITMLSPQLILSLPQDIGLFSNVQFGSININNLILLNNDGTVSGITGILMSGNLDMNNFDIQNVDEITAVGIYGSIMTGTQTNIYQISQTIYQSLEINSDSATPKINGTTIFKVGGNIVTSSDGVNYIANQNFVNFNVPDNIVYSTAIGLQNYGILNFNGQNNSSLTGGYIGLQTVCDILGTENDTVIPFYSYRGWWDLGPRFYSNLNGQIIDNVWGIVIDNNPFPINGTITNLYGMYIGQSISGNVIYKWGIYIDANANFMNGLKLGASGLDMMNNNIINVNEISAIQYVSSLTSDANYPNFEFSTSGYGFYYDGTYLGISTNSIGRFLINNNGDIIIGNSQTSNNSDLITINLTSNSNNTIRVSTLYLNSVLNGSLISPTLLAGFVNSNSITPSIQTSAIDLAGNYLIPTLSPTVTTGTPTITRISAEYIKFSSTIPASMTVTNLSSLYIDTPTITKNGTLTNNYGIYIASPGTSGTNNFALYANDNIYININSVENKNNSLTISGTNNCSTNSQAYTTSTINPTYLISAFTTNTQIIRSLYISPTISFGANTTLFNEWIGLAVKLTTSMNNVYGATAAVNLTGLKIEAPVFGSMAVKTITNYYCIFADFNFAAPGGVSYVANAYALYIPNNTNSFVQNKYGIYCLATVNYIETIRTTRISNSGNTSATDPFINMSSVAGIYSDTGAGTALGISIGPNALNRIMRLSFSSTGILYIGASQTMTQQYSCIINPVLTSTNTTRIAALNLNPFITSIITSPQIISGIIENSQITPAITTGANDIAGIFTNSLLSPLVQTGTPTITRISANLIRFTSTIPVNLTVTNLSSLYIDTPTITKNGTITNNYGIYVASPGTAGTNNFAIYANATSYFNAIQFPTTGGTASLLTYYESGTFSITPSGAWTTPNLTVKFTRTGNNITLTFPNDVSNRLVNASTLTYTTAVPTRLLPPNDVYQVLYGQDNSQTKNLLTSINSSTGTITVAALPTDITHTFTSGTRDAGFYGWCISYSL